MSKSHEKPPEMRLRPTPSDLLEATIGKGDFKPLSEDERAMQKLVLDEYKKDGRVYIKEVQRVREADPKMPLGEAVQKLYKEIEGAQSKKE